MYKVFKKENKFIISFSSKIKVMKRKSMAERQNQRESKKYYSLVLVTMRFVCVCVSFCVYQYIPLLLFFFLLIFLYALSISNRWEFCQIFIRVYFSLLSIWHTRRDARPIIILSVSRIQHPGSQTFHYFRNLTEYISNIWRALLTSYVEWQYTLEKGKKSSS